MLYIRVLYGLIAHLVMLWRGHGVDREFMSDVDVCADIVVVVNIINLDSRFQSAHGSVVSANQIAKTVCLASFV
jgi:hypothetical protein